MNLFGKTASTLPKGVKKCSSQLMGCTLVTQDDVSQLNAVARQIIRDQTIPFEEVCMCMMLIYATAKEKHIDFESGMREAMVSVHV